MYCLTAACECGSAKWAYYSGIQNMLRHEAYRIRHGGELRDCSSVCRARCTPSSRVSMMHSLAPRAPSTICASVAPVGHVEAVAEHSS